MMNCAEVKSFKNGESSACKDGVNTVVKHILKDVAHRNA